MNPTEPQLLAFIQWLEDEQPDSPLVPAATALAELTLNRVQAGTKPLSFNRAQIAIQAGELCADPEKLSSNDHEIARRWLNADDFKALFEGWKNRQITWLRQNDPDCTSFLALREIGAKAGGAGKKKSYLLVSTAISIEQTAPANDDRGAETSAEPDGDAADPVNEGSPAASLAVDEHEWVDGEIAEVIPALPRVLHYEVTICDLNELTPWGRLIFKDGDLRKQSWRWRLHSGRFVFAAIFTFLIVILGLALPLSGIIRLAPLGIVSSILLIGFFLIFELRPWFEVTRDRIRIASDTWLKPGDPAQIEIRRTHQGTEWRLVRYTAICPVCASRVYVEKGEPDFPRRLVGRCSESPREHVFSFDRITRRGKALISPP